MQTVLILDFGGTYSHLLARRVRDCHVYCEVHNAADMTAERIRSINPIGLILTGGFHCTENPAFSGLAQDVLNLNIPVLGVGSGCRIMMQHLGGTLESSSDAPENGRAVTHLNTKNVLFQDFSEICITWMRQNAWISAVPEGFEISAYTADCPVAAFSCPDRKLYGMQFHPEISHTANGHRMLHNFLYQVCGAKGDWTMANYVPYAIQELKNKIGDQKVMLAFSGGVDSAVSATLIKKAVGDQLICVFINHGFMRKGEADEVESVFSQIGLNFLRVDAENRFYEALQGVTDPDAKRQIIWRLFQKIFEEEARKLGNVAYLAQGTNYSENLQAGICANDTSDHSGKYDAHILASDYFRESVEPLRYLFKDEIREMGKFMGLPAYLIGCQPFPIQGLAIRIMGEITPEKIHVLQNADSIFCQYLERPHMDRQLGQYFAVLTETCFPDSDASRYVLALRAVNTVDFRHANWARLPYEMLDEISAHILHDVPQISRVVYDITNKPPKTIEWC